MEAEPIQLFQLPLFTYGEAEYILDEVLPTVWKATELLTSPEINERRHGLGILHEAGAHRVSPLVAYTIATCMNDTDFSIRHQVVLILGELLTRKSSIPQPAITVREVVSHFLHKMNDAMVYGLLEVSARNKAADPSIYHIYNACPYAGKFLVEIMAQWKNPIIIRQRAIYFIGQVGYVDALPGLERILNRLEARQLGQYSMDFVPSASRPDEELLPYLRIAINQLSAG